MSGYDCRNKWLFSFWRNVVSDGADWTSTGRLFQSRGPAAANERSPRNAKFYSIPFDRKPHNCENLTLKEPWSSSKPIKVAIVNRQSGVEDFKYVVVFDPSCKSRDVAHALRAVNPVTRGWILFWWITRFMFIAELRKLQCDQTNWGHR